MSMKNSSPSLTPDSDPKKIEGLVARSTWAKQYVEGKTVLVCGCGSGMETEYYGAACKQLIGLDVDPVAIKFAQANYPHVFMCGDACDLPFADETFDVVVSFEVLEHFHPAGALMYLKEVYRVLKPGGLFVGSTPKVRDHTRWFPMEQEGQHCVLYHERELHQALAVFTEHTLHKPPLVLSWAHLFTARKHEYDHPVRIDLVMLSCHRIDKTCDALESLSKRDQNFHVWLVENGSPLRMQAQLYDRLAGKYPWLSMVFSRRNLFCGGGRELGTRFGQREYVAWFDNDMKFQPKCLTLLQKTLAENPAVGAVCSQVWRGNQVQLNGRRIIDGRVDYSNDNLPKGAPSVKEEFSPDIMHGGATMYRRAALDQTCLDPHYRMGCEDLDIIMQLKAAGWELRNCPKSIVNHYPDHGTDEYSLMRRNKLAIKEDQDYFTQKWKLRI